MIRFACRHCGKPSEIDHFRSRFPETCLSCYKATTRQRNLRLPFRYARMKYQAAKRDIKFNLSQDEYGKLLNQPCHYCGSRQVDFGWGVDRKDNALGYESTNVVPSCAYCNWIKRDTWTYNEMLQLGAVVRKLRAARANQPPEPHG